MAMMVFMKMRLNVLLVVLLIRGPDSHTESFAPPRFLLPKHVFQNSERTTGGFILRTVEIGAEIGAGAVGGDEDGATSSLDGPGSNRTLYDVLQCSPNATRAEMKRSYVALARQTHPDALLALDPNSVPDSATADLPDFNEVARAWKTLSDPRERKRYDRSLEADRISRDIEDAASRAARAAAPRVRNIIDNVALPLLRRTTATTVASIEAARRDLNGTSGGDIGSAFASAVRASRNARRAIDRMELTEKSEDLESRAAEETEKANRLRDELSEVLDRRLGLALRTPGASLSSLEALKILDGFNTVDSVSLMESIVMLRKTLTAEIAALEEAEKEYFELFDEKAKAQKEYQVRTEALEQAEVNAAAAVEAERRAREALVAAQELVASSQQSLTDCTKALGEVEASTKRASAESDRSGNALKRSQERVRKALLRKEEALRIERAKTANAEDKDKEQASDPLPSQGMSTSELKQKNKAEIRELQKQERYLTAESARLEDRAARLRSRADKLMKRATRLDGEDQPPLAQ